MPSHRPQDLAIKVLDIKQPPWGSIYNLSKKEMETLHSYLKDRLQRGWIRHSKSPTRALVLFGLKKDSTLRLSVNFHALNQIPKRNCYSLPQISEAIYCLSGTHYFTKLDICDAYHRLQIAPGDK